MRRPSNFRRRLIEHEQESGEDLLDQEFKDHRDHFMEEFDVDGSTQRMDSTFIEAYIVPMTRLNLVGKVVHNFLSELGDDIVADLPEDLHEFAEMENLDLTYKLAQDEIEQRLQELLEHALYLHKRFQEDERYCNLEPYEHLERVLDEQCVRIPELEDEDSHEPVPVGEAETDPGQADESSWEALRSSSDDTQNSPSENEADQTETTEEETSEEVSEAEEASQSAEDERASVEPKDGEAIASDSLQNPHDDEATYRSKNGDDHHGYKGNICETTFGEGSLRLITGVGLDANNTEDPAFLREVIVDLVENTGLQELIVDGGYLNPELEAVCRELGTELHFTGIKGREPDKESFPLAESEFDGTTLIGCPNGQTPYEQAFTEANNRYSGRFDKSICGNRPKQAECFVDEKQEFFSYGFYQRELEVARHRAKKTDPAMKETLNLLAGVESTIRELTHARGKQTKFTGKINVKNELTPAAIGTNVKRVARANPSGGTAEKSAV